MRNRNFRVRNDVVERGSVTKSQKAKNACVERKAGWCFQWKAHGRFSKGDSCSSSHDKLAQGDLCSGQRRKGRSSSPAPNSKAKTDEGGENPQKHQATKRKALHTTGAKFHADIKIVKTLFVKFGILPCVKTTSLRPHGQEDGSPRQVRNRRQRTREGPEPACVQTFSQTVWDTHGGEGRINVQPWYRLVGVVSTSSETHRLPARVSGHLVVLGRQSSPISDQQPAVFRWQ